MSEIQDSAAIIAADMRQLADDIEAGRAIVGQSVWRSYADRVEAIGTVGNIAKLREAVRLVSRVAEQMTRGTIKGEAPTRKEVDEWAVKLYDIIDVALAAPPRECDRFNTWNDAFRECVFANKFRPAAMMTAGEWMEFLNWFTAPAKEVQP